MTQLVDAKAWVSARMTPQNWLNVRPDEEIPDFISGWDRTFAHMFQISFAPEIRKRLECGLLNEDFVLTQVQMVQPLDGHNYVRINDEVRGRAYLKTERSMNEGEGVLLSDMLNLEVFDLLEDDLDSGHFTLFYTGFGWVGSFDFRTGRARGLAYTRAAKQFLRHARNAAEMKHVAPAVDNLFSALELLAKSILLTAGLPAGKAKGHGSIHSGINAYRSQGNVEGSFVDLFNRVTNLRPRARYMVDDSAPLPLESDFQIAELMAEKLESSYEMKRRN